MRKEGCTKCCWCGFDYGTTEFDMDICLIHACTGEEQGAVQCPEQEKCWGEELRL